MYHTQEGGKQASTQSHPEMTQMLELKDEDLKTAITMFKSSWEMMALMSEQVGNLRREIETLRRVNWVFQK